MPRKKPARRIPHHSDTAEHPIRQSEDIGPFYRFMGVAGLLATLTVFLVGRLHKDRLEWEQVVGYVTAFLVCLFLIRPRVVDGWVKKAADALPSRLSKYSLSE